LKIELLDGTRYDIADYDLKRLFHYIPSAEIYHNSVAVDGRSDIIIGSKINNRIIRVEFLYISQDIYDYYLLREQINALFIREESFYITFKREPHKRWLVKTNLQYELPPDPKMQSFVIEFITQNTYAESVATTQSLKEWDFNSWAWNGSISWDSEIIYNFNNNDFTVYNLGNVDIDPRESEIEIIIKGDFPNGLRIRNETTGQTYIYNSALSTNDELKINGIRTLKNGVSDFANTNKRFITIKKGQNNIFIDNGTIQSVTFNFRFLYK